MSKVIIKSNTLHDNIMDLKANPGKIQQYMLNLVERLTKGEVIPVDATNPAVLCLESAAVLSSAVMTDNESKLRRQYPAMAMNREELYHHMSDVDYLYVYSRPANAKITLMFDLDEILQKAVDDHAVGGTRRLTIPRYTKVTIAEKNLHLLYPVDIRVMPHKGFNVTFNVNEFHPLSRVDNNALNWFVEVIDDIRFLNVEVPFHQVNIDRHLVNVNSSTGFVREYSLNGRFCYARAFIQNATGNWVEIHTTHSDLVYNKDIPTVVFKLLNNSIKVTIPQIYLNNGVIRDAIRLDIYTTEGELDVSLINYTPNSYLYDWNPILGNGLDKFSSPLETLSTVACYSSGSISGGSNGITFDQLKTNITSRSVVYEGLPISEKQLVFSANNMGYNLVKNIDNITDRQYLATRYLPTPSSEFIASRLGVTVGMLETSLIKLKELDTVTTSAYRLTIKPETLYELKDGVLNVLSSRETNQLKQSAKSNPYGLVNTLNSKTILFSPYYYVFDVKNNEIVNRIYDLDNPVIKSRYFFQDNASVGINLGISEYSLTMSKDGDGYVLEVKLSVGEVIKQLGPNYVNVQLSYLDRYGKNRFYIDGELVTPIDKKSGLPEDDEYIYRFLIETRYDIDSDDGLIPIPYRSPINLVHEFDVVTIINGYNPDGRIVKTDIDSIINHSSLPGYNVNKTYFGVSQNKLTIEFGKRLKHLWHKTRSVVGDRIPETWDKNVPATYTEDQYKLDANGNIEVKYNAQLNNITTTKLHSKGDLILTPSGEQVYKHRKGDPKFDENGNPIYKDGGDGLNRQIDLLLMDAKYLFANTKEVQDYKEHCISLITQWCVDDMNLFYQQLLDRSEIFFHPSITIGNIRVLADDNKEVVIDSRQSLKVTCFISEIDMQNAGLRDALIKTITVTIQQALNRKTVSKDAILQSLRSVVGDTVKSFVIDGLLEDKYKTVTLDNDALGLTIGSIAHILPNMQIDIRDDINVEFLVHDKT